MPRTAKTSSEVKKTVTKKRTATKSKKTVKTVKRVSRKKAITPEPQVETIIPEVFTLTPSLTHGHTTYQLTSEFTPSRKPRRNLTIVLCVSIVMTVIVGAWILSLKRFINFDAQAASPSSQTQTDFANLKEELDSTMQEVRSQLQNLDDLKATTPTSTVPPENEQTNNKAVRDAFKNLAEKSVITNTTTPATSTEEPAMLPH